MNRDIIELAKARISGGQMNFSANDADQAIRNAFIEKFGTDKITKKLFRRHQVEIFELIEEVLDTAIVDSEMRKSEFFNQFVDFRSLPEGSINSFYIPSNSEVVIAKTAKGSWVAERQHLDLGESVVIPTNAYVAKIYEEFSRFVSGRVDFGAFTQKMVVAFQKFVGNLAYDTFASAVSKLPTIFKYTGSYSKDKVISVIQSVEAANGGEAILVGSKNALSKLVETTYLSDNAKDQIMVNGAVGYYFGNRVSQLPQGFKAGSIMTGTPGSEVPDFIFDDSTVYVISTGDEKMVKMVYEGSEMNRSVDQYANDDMTLEETIVMQVGCAVCYNGIVGVCKLT